MKNKNIADKLVISNVNIWNADGIRSCQDVFVENGIVKDIRPHSSNIEGEVINGKSMVLMPSGVDAHVHLRIPGQAHKESPLSGLHAAIRGGYGAVLNMPNTRPPVDSVEVCELAMSEMQEAISKTGVDVFLSACITKGMKGEEMVDVDSLAEWGVKTFTDDGLGVESDEIMNAVFKAAEEWNIPVSQHAEYCGHGGVLAGGKVQRDLKTPDYPSSAEYDMVARDIRELRNYPNARYHVLHVSLGKTVQLVVDARREGLNVSCEVTPHHIYYTFNEIRKGETSFKMNPPLRDGYDRHVLVKALKDKDVAFVATDHAPHSDEEKGDQFENAAFGTTGMETSLRVLIDMYQRKEISEQRLVEVFSSSPAQYLDIDHRYGHISEGREFNAILIDPNFKAAKITDADLSSKSRNNVFKGVSLPGKILHFFNSTYHFQVN